LTSSSSMNPRLAYTNIISKRQAKTGRGDTYGVIQRVMSESRRGSEQGNDEVLGEHSLILYWVMKRRDRDAGRSRWKCVYISNHKLIPRGTTFSRFSMCDLPRVPRNGDRAGEIYATCCAGEVMVKGMDWILHLGLCKGPRLPCFPSFTLHYPPSATFLHRVACDS
jgi:hypothetical protein